MDRLESLSIAVPWTAEYEEFANINANDVPSLRHVVLERFRLQFKGRPNVAELYCRLNADSSWSYWKPMVNGLPFLNSLHFSVLHPRFYIPEAEKTLDLPSLRDLQLLNCGRIDVPSRGDSPNPFATFNAPQPRSLILENVESETVTVGFICRSLVPLVSYCFNII